MVQERRLAVWVWLLAAGFAALDGSALAAREPQPGAGVRAEPAVPVARRAAVEALYRDLEESEARYLLGIERIAAGEEVEGEMEVASAARSIHAAARTCAKLAGCDVGRFLSAHERLLATQQVALTTVVARTGGLESELDVLRADADPVEREPGTASFGVELPGASVPSLLRGTDLREVIQLNGPVRAALDDWLTWMRPLLIESYENYWFLRSEIAPIYEEAGLPEALLFAMMATETGGKVHAQSRAGAAGPLQFMRRTGQRYGLDVVGGFDQRLDPVAATRAAVEYLDERFGELGGSLEKALAAYNGGETRVVKLDRKLGGKSFWDPAFYYALPRETREYVPRILAAAWLYMHPEQYNLEFPSYGSSVVTLPLEQDMAIGELTICLGQGGNDRGWFRTLRNLNPQLKPAERIEAGTSIRVPAELVPLYEQHCRQGAALGRARELYDANYPAEPASAHYVVQREDTLSKIAARHSCVSLGQLAEMNDVRPPSYTIHVGQELKVPDCD